MRFHKLMVKRAGGFSLLELMVVVAIIGVLATFAVPRFNVFRARARQGEAKSNLGVIFTLQEAFKIDKEEYYDGDGAATAWGGAYMDAEAAANSSGYDGAGAYSCEANKLGFRLANCKAARYRYWVKKADEFEFLVFAYAESDSQARIFPGCAGDTTNTGDATNPGASTTGKDKCTGRTTTGARSSAYTDTLATTLTGGDAFCLDQDRVVDNFRDIVGDADCTD